MVSPGESLDADEVWACFVDVWCTIVFHWIVRRNAGKWSGFQEIYILE